MNNSFSKTIEFRFRFVDEGFTKGYLGSKTGSFDGDTLHLQDIHLPADSMYDVEIAEKILSITYLDAEGTPSMAAFTVYRSDLKELKQAIDISRSDRTAARKKEQLISAGNLAGFRAEICPHCQATITLINLPHTPQIYCDYCTTLYTTDGNLDHDSLDRAAEKKHRLCDECNMYSHPRQFAVFYFYFVLVLYGWSYRKTYRCPGCMRGDAWKMFVVNIFGLLGLPIAIMQLIRSYFPRENNSQMLKGLDNANVLANKGKIEKALDQYESMMESLPLNAGIKYNIGSGLVTKGDYAHAEPMFQMSLEDCANYWPSFQGLHACYQMQEKTAELNQLRLSYGIDDED